MSTINIANISKGVVLAALYNASRPLGLGFMQYDPKPMTPQEGEELLKHCTYFDYLKGRVMKIDLSGDTFNPGLYDRDNGDGAAERAIQAIGSPSDGGGVNSPTIQ